MVFSKHCSDYIESNNKQQRNDKIITNSIKHGKINFLLNQLTSQKFKMTDHSENVTIEVIKNCTCEEFIKFWTKGKLDEKTTRYNSYYLIGS